MKLVVSFIVVALNAASTIESLFDCLKRQSYPHRLIEVILIDGMSEDVTKEKMLRFQAEESSFRHITVLENPKRTLPCGWNVALDAAQGDVLLRVDAHVMIPDDFIEKNIAVLQRGEDICGGKVISVPANDSKWAIVLNEAENSMFGGGIAAFRRADEPRYVSTAAFAAYRKTVFERVGRYNEMLTRTEDNEMHYRMRRAGFRFFYDPSIVSCRKTRADLFKLLKQKYLNGYWIGRTLAIEPRCFSVYHFVPLAFVLSIAASAVLGSFGITWPAVILWSSYAVADMMMTTGSVISCESRSFLFVTLPLVFPALHICYGVGTLIGIIRSLGPKPAC